ncbi:hypothetical protein INS49_013448 [Diaporthe citri]|uniref:uncharacterized protein n=1 Tax=Diaporthe citri TaxID=83186 RepID=UPI001C7E4B2F|nr:uncharacterized protein INS49_013448 [Diaporthe citri]KAG6357571.1 hypothetical protein INS49_013448 [Diaporthe citri]
MTTPNADRGGERVQSFLWDQTQQGNAYVPGKEAKQSRAERVKRTIQGVEQQFPNPSSAQGLAQGGQPNAPSNFTTNTAQHYYTYNGMNAELNGVGQQFQGYGNQ